MTIRLSGAGKRFNRDWIFRKVTAELEAGKSYAITGPNGSGKSTLLQVIAASIQANEGSVEWKHDRDGNWQTVNENDVFQYIALCAPYLEVIEEMTAAEFLAFHAAFKPLLPGIRIPEILRIIGLDKATDKQIRYFSSGMKQRIKLAQAVFSDVPVLLLDEPCTNLDAPGFALYHHLVETYCQNKLIVVSSNDMNEYDFCEARLNILDYK